MDKSPDFTLTPSDLSLCALLRHLTSPTERVNLQPDVKFVFHFVRLCSSLISKGKHGLSTLSRLVSLLSTELGEKGVLIGVDCRDQLARMSNSMIGLRTFIKDVKNDLSRFYEAPALLTAIPMTGRLPLNSPAIVFIRRCVASFENMTFERANKLLKDLRDFCPSMLDFNQTSHLTEGKSLHGDRLQDASERLMLGILDPSEDVMSLLDEKKNKPAECLIKHEIEMLRLDFMEARRALDRYCGTLVDSAKDKEFLCPKRSLSLKLASIYLEADEIRSCRVALEEAFEVAECREDHDGVPMLSCVVSIVQLMLHTIHSDPEEDSLAVLNRLLNRSYDRAREIRAPHLLAFAMVAKSLLALKHGNIDGLTKNNTEVHKFIVQCETKLRQLREYVADGTVLSQLTVRPKGTPGKEVGSVFPHAKKIFGPGVSQMDPVLPTINQLLVKLQIYLAVSWKRIGHHSLSVASAMSVETAFRDIAHLEDRADAMAFLLVDIYERKGCKVAGRLWEVIKKLRDLGNQRSLVTAWQLIQVQNATQSETSDLPATQWLQIDSSLYAIDGKQAYRMSPSIDASIDTLIRTMSTWISMEREIYLTEIKKNIDAICHREQLLCRLPDVQLINLRMRYNQMDYDDIRDMTRDVDKAAVSCQSTMFSAEIAIMSCAEMLCSDSQLAPWVERICSLIMPLVISEGSLSLQKTLAGLLINAKLAQDDIESLYPIVKYHCRISEMQGEVQCVRAICQAAKLMAAVGNRGGVDKFLRALERVARAEEVRGLKAELDGIRSHGQDRMETD